MPIRAHQPRERGVDPVVALHAFVVRVAGELLEMCVGRLELELRADHRVAPARVDQVARADRRAVLEFQSHAVRVAGQFLHGGFLAHFRADLAGAVEEHFVEIRALDLIRAVMLQPEALLEIKLHRALPARRRDFAAVFVHRPRIEPRANAQPVERRQRIRQQRFPDVKPRKFLPLQHDHAPPFLREQHRRRAARRAAADDGYVVKFLHECTGN